MARPIPGNGDPKPVHDPLASFNEALGNPQPARVPAGDEPQIRGRHVLRPVEEYTEYEEEQRLMIPKPMWPAGFDLLWVTESVWGMPEMQHRARFERAGWVAVHQEDFEARFRGMFHPAKYEGEIKCDGLVLMARSAAWSEKAKQNNINRARQRVFVKEQQLRQGALEGVTLGPQHPTALRSNVIERSMDTVSIPVPQK